jgi:hypothetical protein
MRTKNGKQFWLFDNGGETFDRYTIITHDGHVYGSSTEPFHPQGFGQYCGECGNLQTLTRLSTFLPKSLIFAEIQKYLKDFRQFQNNGKEKEILSKRSKAWISLTDSVKNYIEQVNE